MRFTYPDELHDFVQATELCNCDSPEVIAKAEELAKVSSSAKDAALQIFNYVRDNFLFGLTRADEKASETLKGTIGWCVTKTNLQVALLRALGIPARYHQVVLHKRALRGIISDSIFKRLDERIWFYPWCECFLSGKWIICDLYLDKYTYLAAVQESLITKKMIPTIHWDGESDLKLVTSYMLEDLGVHASYDDISLKVVSELKGPSFLLNFMVKRSNRFTARMRDRYR